MKQDNKQVTDTSKAKIVEWFMKLHGTEWENIKNKYTLPDVGNITDEQIEHIYLSEHPQPTDTGNTVSSEVGFTGGEWNMYISEKGKDGCSRAYINSALPNDMYETICTMAGLNGTEPGEQAKANAQRIVQAVNNHDKLVSALTELIEVFKGAWATDKDKETYYKAIELLNNISNK